MHTLEDMVKTLNTTTSAFALAGDMQVFRDGLADAARRIQALEAEMKAKNTPAALPPATK